MATLDWQLRRAGEATLVELFVHSETDARVEIASNLQPVWPPRRRNRPAGGWDDSGYEGTVAAGDPLVLGYASPDDPVEPPATIVDTEPVSGGSGEPPTPEALVRELGEAGPPRDAVPTPDDPHGDAVSTGDSPPDDDTSTSGESVSPDRSQSAGRPTRTDQASPADGQPSDRPARDDPASSRDRSESGESRPSTSGQQSNRAESAGEPANGPSVEDGPSREPGAAIDTWLAAVDRRIETAQRLAAVETAEEARAAVSAAGGIESVRALCERLDADRDRLERVDEQRAAFDRRLADADVPLSALERLA
jgi:hypothetical protein